MDTASVIAARYGVPQEALLRTNGLTSAAQVRPGTQLVVPIYNAAARSAPAASAPAASAQRPNPAPAAARPTEAPRAETLQSPAANGAQRVAALTPPATPRAGEPARPAQAETAKPAQPAARQPAQPPARPEASKPAAPAQAAATKTEPEAPRSSAAASADEKPEFRWPARGRIIQGFRSGSSDGIAIAVPEGTAVKAAEAGVVAYAGNELKGYGNLVLIRHPNGFVSAYAHNGELNVKRGDTVKRGQVIAKSGQTGNVSSPQLHFELRKGSTPVDPTAYLAGL